MTVVSTSSFDELARQRTGPCVTILMPVDRRHPVDRRDHVLLKNLVASARRQLRATHVAHVEDLLADAELVLLRPVIAEHSGGLGLFAAPGVRAEHHLDTAVEPLATVGGRFTIGPLLSSVGRGTRCYVLAVAARHVTLYRVDDDGWTRCAVRGMATQLDDALWFERSERMSGSHAGGPRGASGLSIIGHGTGAQDEDRKEQLSRFFHLVDDAVVAFMRAGPPVPLVVAGTAPVVARYQQISRHRDVVPAPVGSVDELSFAELRAAVGRTIGCLPLGDGERLSAEVAAKLGSGLASTEPFEIAAAAEAGRVDELLVASTAPRWVHADGGVALDAWEPGADDLVSRAIGDAWCTGAQVHQVPIDSLPDGAPLAALYRY